MAEEDNIPVKTEGKKTANLLIIGLFSFLITVIIAVTFLTIVLRNPAPARTMVHVEQKDAIGTLVPIAPEIIVNLNSESGDEHYLKVNLVVEVQGMDEKQTEEIKTEVTNRIPQFRDAIITILRSKTKEEIDAQGGKEAIRKEIIKTFNNFLISGKIKNIYFQDFVIQ